MNTFSRKDYNSHYYARNKERILLKRQIRKLNHDGQHEIEANQLSLFEQSNFGLNPSNGRRRFNVEKVLNSFLILLVVSNSYLLLRDAVEFYRFNDTHTETSVLSAVIVELMLIALSVIRVSNPFLKVATKCALLLLFVYSSWSFCSVLIGKGYGAIEQRSVIEHQIKRIEDKLQERARLINENLKRQRITMARRLTLEKDSLNQELEDLENKRAASLTTTSDAQKLNTWAMVALRLLLQFSNIVLVHHLGAYLGKATIKRSAAKLTRQVSPIRILH